MGGIIGKLSFERDEPLARPMLEQMLDAVWHRGGSVRSIHQQPGLALGSTTTIATRGPLYVAVDADAVHASEIATAYARLGDGCFRSLEGGFACAVWDGWSRRLVLARDHIGARPLYFAMLPGHGLVFASELTALFQDPGVQRESCPAAIDAYLTLGYVPAPLTVFKRISKVEPAQIIVVEGRRLHAERYWQLPEASAAVPLRRVAQQLDTCLRMATRGRATEGEWDLLHSGGAASSALLLTAPRNGAMAITVALDQDPADIARAFAIGQALGRPPEIELAALTPDALVPEVARAFEEPVSDPDALTQYALFSAARTRTRRALTGHGGNVLFEAPRRYTVWEEQQRRSIYTRAFAWEVRDANPRGCYQDLCAEHLTDDPRERSRYVTLRSILPERILAVAERASLAAGLTVRSPWVDRHVVELASSLPPDLSRRDGIGSIVRRLLGAQLPAELMPRPSASRAPRWLPSTLSSMVPTVLLGPRFDGRGIVSRPALRQLWDEHCARRHDHSLRFWSLLMLELWFREHIDDDAAEQPLEYAILKAA